ncbi:MAG: leucine-rich repeat protein, partial [Lachnospiraceae bacterium]|nr:leucine-rich repeat protein [Lachnospiraceae bacterium]
IPDYTFQNCESLETVTLPDSVSEIKSYAFYECTSLSSMKLPEYITSIGAYAFYDCSSWKDAKVPETLTGVINEYSYYYCSYLTDITVSSNVTTIGNRSFKNCNNLKSIDFATREDGTTSLTSIGFDVFCNCRLLTEVDIPEGVQFIDSFAFTQCSALKRATIPSTVTKLGTGSRGSVNGSFLFEYCSNLKQLIIKNSALEIPQNIFRNSGSDTDTIYIYSEEKDTEGNDTKIKSWVDNYSETYRKPEFVDISKLDDPDEDPAIGSGSGSALATSGQIPLYTTDEETGYIKPTGVLMWEYNTASNTLTLSQNRVGETFGYSDPEWINFSSEIKNVNFLDGELAVTCLPKNAFYNCIMLEEISLPDGLTEIPYNAFYGCTSLKTVKIPSGVVYIESYAFGNCLSLEKVEIPASTEVINYNAFNSCSKLKELSIPDDSKLVRIGDDAFVYCSSLTSVTIPASVEYIDDHAFAYCTALETVTFNEGLKYISEYAFYATVIKALELPASLATIEDPVFRGMSKLTTITVAADNDTYYSNEKGDRLFLKKDDSIVWWSPGEDPTKLFIPKEAEEDFDIAEIITTDMTTVEVEEGNTAFSVHDNAIYSYDGSRLIRVLYSATGEFSVRKGTSIISKNAFNQCKNLTSVIIPDSVYEIGDYAFYSCTALKSVDLSAKTAVIGKYAFSYCTSLESIQLPYTLTSIGNYAFYGCRGLNSVTIPGQVEILPDNCFANCSSLSDVRFSSGLKEINYGAFYYCTSLTYLKLPEGLESIHDSAFKYCSKLERIDIPESVSFIYTTDWYVKDNTVYNCQSPFDYCSADLILYVVYGSYAYDHVMTQRYAYLDGDRNLSALLKNHYELLSSTKYHITYALDHSLGEVNSTSNPDSYRMEDDAIEFEPASKEGYDFEGWYRDKLFKNRIDRLIPYFEGADITLYPRWIKLHNVTIKVDGQTDETMTVADGNKADIKDPVKEGSTFIGWVKGDGTSFCSEEPVTADMTITASFAAEGTDFLFAPVSDVWSGIVPSGTEVTLRTASEGASIQYTLDGSSPSGDTATVYSAPITITGEPGDIIQLKAVTVLSGKTSTVTVISLTLEDNRGEWGDVLVADRADFANADAVPEGLWVGNLTGDIYYTGKKIVPEVRIYYGKTLLEEKTDYKLSFKNNLKAYELSEGDSEFNPKKAPTLTVKGAGNYKDKTLVRNFIIKAAKMEMTAPVFNTYNEYNEWYYTG